MHIEDARQKSAALWHSFLWASPYCNCQYVNPVRLLFFWFVSIALGYVGHIIFLVGNDFPSSTLSWDGILWAMGRLVLLLFKPSFLWLVIYLLSNRKYDGSFGYCLKSLSVFQGSPTHSAFLHVKLICCSQTHCKYTFDIYFSSIILFCQLSLAGYCENEHTSVTIFQKAKILC